MKRVAFTLFVAFMMIGLSAPAQGQPAIPEKGVNCFLYLPDGEPDNDGCVDGLFMSNEKTTKILTNSKKGNATVSCHADLPAGVDAPSKTEHYSANNPHPVMGFTECFVVINGGAVPTTNWHARITPSGKSHLSCQLNPSSN